MRPAAWADATRASLVAEAGATAERFDPATLRDLPDPARRFLRRAVPAGAPLDRAVAVDLTGEIRLGRPWLPFTARQVLVAGVGFVWQPVVGSGLLGFTGADALTAAGATTDFRLRGLVPVVRASGPDVTRSAAGRLAAETVAWAPQAVTPQAGARWSPVDRRRAVVSVAAAGGSVDVEITVEPDGRLRSLALERWNDRHDPARLEPFGARVDRELVGAHGIRIAGAGVVGWWWETPDWLDGEFYRFSVTSACPVRTVAAAVDPPVAAER